jgi:hydroxymethylpyrimidine/phosphomethylpyrimidine kinase
MQKTRPTHPVVLTIAGSDSGGGAGVQADLKTFAAFGVHGTSAISCLTAQNPKRVLAVEPCSPTMLRRQLEAVFEELPPRAVKTGMLYSVANVRTVADFFGARARVRPRVPLVVDPVMVSTSGAPLLARAAKRIMMEKLFPLATLVTPNLDEVKALLGTKPDSLEAMRQAAREIHRRFGCAVVVKGGHLRGKRAGMDIFYDGATELELAAPKVFKIRTHGTGCTFSAAICAALALGDDLPTATRMAKRFVTSAIEHSYRIGKHLALNQTRHQ